MVANTFFSQLNPELNHCRKQLLEPIVGKNFCLIFGGNIHEIHIRALFPGHFVVNTVLSRKSIMKALQEGQHLLWSGDSKTRSLLGGDGTQLPSRVLSEIA